MPQDLTIRPPTISFGNRLASSSRFKTLFRDGMALVETTAAYLDGDGRDEARRLPRMVALSYASESMRLTTRLMQIASWLLLQRAVNEGEMTEAEAAADKRRTRIAWQQPLSAAQVADQALPETLKALMENSLRLQDRIVRLDSMMSEAEAPAGFPVRARPLEAQMSRLREAFGS